MGIETTYKGKVEDWDRLQERLTANAVELAHLDVLRTRLAAVMEQARQIAATQSAQKAAKQEASKSLKEAVVEGDRLANLLRVAVKQHYGVRAEKLAEFGVQPFRGRNRTSKAKGKKKSQTPETPTPQPPAASAEETAR